MKALQLSFYTIIVLLASVAARLLAATTNGLPNEVSELLSAEAAVQVIAVIGLVTATKNLFPNLKGVVAIIFTVVTSLLFGIIKYGVGPEPLGHGVVIGGVAAYVFFVTNNFGKLQTEDPLAANLSGWRQVFALILYVIGRYKR